MFLWEYLEKNLHINPLNISEVVKIYFQFICRSFYRNEFLPRLLHASQTYLRPEHMELPVGLMSRLIVSDVEFVNQFAQAVKQYKVKTKLGNYQYLLVNLIRWRATCF